MKRIAAILIALAMMLSLVACGSSEGTDTAASNAGQTETGAKTEQADTAAENNTGTDNAQADVATDAAEIDAGWTGTYLWPTLAEVEVDPSRKSTANSDEQYEMVKVAVTNVPSDLSPYTMSNAITNMSIFDTLLEQTGAQDFVGRMAKEWHDEDDTHMLLTIYDYVYDSDNNHITASDVVFSFNTYKDSGFARDFNNLESVEAVDDYTVRFTWKEKNESLTAFASMMTKTYIVSEKAFTEHDFVTDPVGTGPYKLVDYVTAGHATIQARDDYWQTDESLVAPNAHRNVKTIEFDFISDASMTAIAFENGDTVNVTLDADTLSLFEEGGQYDGIGQLVCYPDTVSTTILPNMSADSLMSDLNMRLAVFNALDGTAFADALGTELWYAVSTDAANSIADFDSSYIIPDTYQGDADYDAVAEYLSAAGYNGETLKIMYEGNKDKEIIAQIINAYLESAGIKSEIVAWDHDLIKAHASVSTEWDIFLASSGDSDFTANRLRKVYGADAGYTEGQYNISFYDNDEFQTMLKNDNTLSGNSVEATREILQFIYDNALGMGTAYKVNVMCYSHDIASFQAKYSTSEIVYGSCEYYLD